MDSSQIESITAIVGATTGILALLLSVVNFWTQYMREKVRLSADITVKQTYPDHDLKTVCHIINLSKFPVYVYELNLVSKDGNRAPLLQHTAYESKCKLPLELKQRESYELIVDMTSNDVRDSSWIEVATSCGHTQKSSLSKFKKMYKKFVSVKND